MEVVTKVACGSVIAGGGGAAGAYGVHRLSTAYETESSVPAPAEQKESEANNDVQVEKAVDEDQNRNTTPEERPATETAQDSNPKPETNEGEKGSAESETPAADGSLETPLTTDQENTNTEDGDSTGEQKVSEAPGSPTDNPQAPGS